MMSARLAKPKLGRPRKYEGRRAKWTVRLQAKYADRIRAIAAETGRSLSEVCEERIGMSFDLPADRDFFARMLAVQTAAIIAAVKGAE